MSDKTTAPSDVIFALGQVAIEQSDRIRALEADLAAAREESRQLQERLNLAWASGTLKRLDELEAENRRLREALEPFRQFAHLTDKWGENEHVEVSVKMLRSVRAALAVEQDGPEAEPMIPPQHPSSEVGEGCGACDPKLGPGRGGIHK